MRSVFNPLTPPFDKVSESADIDHGSVTGLADDDHAQYVMLQGRHPSTQTFRHGGPHTSTVDVKFQEWASTITLDSDGLVFAVLEATGTILQNDSIGLTGNNIFQSAFTYKNYPSQTAGLGTLTPFAHNTAIIADGVTTSMLAVNGFRAAPQFSVLNSGVLTVTNARGLIVAPAVGSGVTVTTLSGVQINAPTGSGTVTTQLSLVSAAAAATMRHAGAAVFGANAAATNASVGLEVQSTTQAFLLPRMTTTQRDAMTAVNGMVIYNTTTGVIEGREGGAWVNL